MQSVNPTANSVGITELNLSDGSNGQAITTNGSGTLSFATTGGDLSFGGDTFGADKTIGSNDAYALSLETNSNVAIKMDANGHVTMPLQSAFSAQAGSTLSNVATNNSVHTVPVSTEIFDLNADFNTSTYTFTAPVTGKYLLTFSATLDNVDTGATYVVIYIKTSNRNYSDSNTFGINGYSADEPRVEVSQTVVADMDASDTAIIAVRQHEGTAQMDVGDDGCHFSGYLVA
jgi:hypothetical protein